MFQRKRGASVRQIPQPWIYPWLSRLRLMGASLSLFGIVGVAHGGWQLLQDERFFPLRHVQVAGEMRNLHSSDIQQVVKHYLGNSFVALDIGMLRDTFLLNPWVEQISIQRSWPDTLNINVRERTVFAHWGDRDMVDEQGMRFQPGYFRAVQLWPRLSAADGHEKLLLQTFEQAQRRLDDTGLRIVFLEMDERRAWRMRFDNGIAIELGRERLFSRLQRFIDIYPRVLAQRAGSINTVDMRYMNGFAVRWNESAGDDAHRANGFRELPDRSARMADPWRGIGAG